MMSASLLGDAAAAQPGMACCGQCGRSNSPATWHRLPLVEVLSGERLHDNVTRWPCDTCVEIRRCECGQPIARKARRADGE